MRVLVSEAAPGEAADVIQRLQAAGHTVVTCRGGNRCPMALGQSCPIVDSPVDVVVHTRGHPHPLDDHDRPLMCGVVAQVPTVLCGFVDDGPGPWTRADAWCSPTGVVDAVEHVAGPTGPAAVRRVRDSMASVLRRHEMQPPHHVDVVEADGVVDVLVVFSDHVPVIVREHLRAAARAALSRFTPHWAYARVRILDGVPQQTSKAGDAHDDDSADIGLRDGTSVTR